MTKWDKRFIEMSELVSTWSSCFRAGRQVGAVIVKDNRILTTGYNGAPQNHESCVEKKVCMRDLRGIQSGTKQEECYAVHAEQNAIVQAARQGISIDGATIYCTHQPCVICAKIIINSGIERIVYKNEYPDEFSVKLLAEAGVKLEKYM